VRTSVRIMTAAAAASIGFLAFAVTPAMASVAAPDCESGASTVVCNGFGGTSPITWTITEHWDGTDTYSYQTTSGYTKFTCNRAASFNVTFSYVSGGVTQTSASDFVACNPGDWQ
jgi:hypothetical protein